MVQEIAPVVAEVAGRDFDDVPEVVLADAHDLANVIYREQVHLLSAIEGMSSEQIEDQARRSAAQAPAFSGKYGFLDRRLYVSVDEIRYTLGARGNPAYLLRPMVRVVIAHELAHALQDQHADLDHQVLQAPGGDAVMAINCTVEGHAVWVHEAVAARMGLGEAVEVMAQLMGYDEPIQGTMDPDSFYHSYLYGLGRDFVAFHAALGGTEQVWRVLLEPPIGTSQIVAPERWGRQHTGVSEVMQEQLASQARRLAGRRWRSDGAALGDFDVRDQLIRAGSDGRGADGLQDGWNASYLGDPHEGVEVQLLRFDSPSAAASFVINMRARSDVQAQAVALDPFIEATGGDFDRLESDVSARESIVVRLFGQPDRFGKVWVARGSDVVQVVSMNTGATDRQLARAIQRVFRALERQRG